MSTAAQKPDVPRTYDVPLARDHVSVSATTTFHVHRGRGRRLKIRTALYVADAAFTADLSNYFVLTLRIGATVIGTINLSTTSLVAGTPVAFTLAADRPLVGPDDEVTLVATETGTAVLPAGRLEIDATKV